MRARGTGSITPFRGRWRVRLPVDGRMESKGVYDTYEAAEDALHIALERRASVPSPSATVVTFAVFGRRVLDMREGDGVRGIASERRAWRRHLEQCSFAGKAVAEVTPQDVDDLSRTMVRKRAADHRAKRRLSKETIQRVLTLGRCIYDEAIRRTMCERNPFAGVRIKGAVEHTSQEAGDGPWDWLRGDEQVRFLSCEEVPEWFRVMVRVAWGTGLRQGEMWNLELKDVHVAQGSTCSCGVVNCHALAERGPHIFVRYGSKGHLPPKNGTVRRTMLFGEGLAGMQAWLDLLPSYLTGPNEHGLAFPSKRGHRRQPGAPERSGPRQEDGSQNRIELLPEMLRKAGVSREVRWHDLRHTCASSLISGTWGRAWPLIAVRDQLGHKNIKTTERYAHLSSDTLRNEGLATPGHVTSLVTGNGPGGMQVAAIRNESCEGGDLNPYASYGSGSILELPGLSSTSDTSVTSQDEEWIVDVLPTEERG